MGRQRYLKRANQDTAAKPKLTETILESQLIFSLGRTVSLHGLKDV